MDGYEAIHKGEMVMTEIHKEFFPYKSAMKFIRNLDLINPYELS